MVTLASFFHPSYFEGWLETQIRAASPLHCALINATISPETQTVAQIIANEAANSNGYARQSISVASLNITYSATNNRAEFDEISCAFAASGGDISYQSAILIIGGSGTWGNTSGSIINCVQWPTPQTLANGAPPFSVKFQLQEAIGVGNTVGTNPAF